MLIVPIFTRRATDGRWRDMRTFTMYRRNVPDESHDENQKNPPDDPQFEGVVFSDGKCVIRWLTGKRSVAVWDSFEDMMAIHGHPEYGSEMIWGKLGREPFHALKDVVNQACAIQEGDESEWYLDTLCIGSYEDAIELLVELGEAEWIIVGRTARWK